MPQTPADLSARRENISNAHMSAALNDASYVMDLCCTGSPQELDTALARASSGYHPDGCYLVATMLAKALTLDLDLEYLRGGPLPEGLDVVPPLDLICTQHDEAIRRSAAGMAFFIADLREDEDAAMTVTDALPRDTLHGLAALHRDACPQHNPDAPLASRPKPLIEQYELDHTGCTEQGCTRPGVKLGLTISRDPQGGPPVGVFENDGLPVCAMLLEQANRHMFPGLIGDGTQVTVTRIVSPDPSAN